MMKRAKPLPEYRGASRRIVAVDGEGMDISGRHSYTLLAAADDQGFSAYVETDGSRREAEGTVRQPNYGLPTVDCLDFLLSLRKRHSDLFVAFAFTYDANKIISDLTQEQVIELAATEKVMFGKYRIEFRPRKYLKIAIPSAGKKVMPDGSTGYRKGITVWDAFGYFQQSFVSALYGSAHLFDESDMTVINVIADMKAKRSNFENVPKEEILSYCFSECRFLSTMMRDVCASVEKLGLYPRSFHGASAIAQRWLKDNNISAYLGEAGIPEDVIKAAYYGGRFEHPEVGRVGSLSEDGHRYLRAYDINSAYPAVMVGLPCLAHATSRKVTEFEPGKYGVYLVGSETEGTWAPFPIRVDKEAAARANGFTYKSVAQDTASEWLRNLVNHQVLFAHGGKRWVWQDEVEIARKHHGDAAIPVYEGYVIETGCNCPPPLAEIADLYKERQRIKSAEPGLQMALKLLINSIYGKFAQSIGHRIKRGLEGDAKTRADIDGPEFLCRIWAGMITSGCRARVYDAIMRSGHAVSVATDGIICTEPIDDPEFADSKELGRWEAETYRDVILYQSGIYTYDVWDEKKSEWKTDKIKSRGFSPRDITVGMLRAAWDSGMSEVGPETACRHCNAQWIAYPKDEKCPVCAEAVERPRNFMGHRAAMKRKEADRMRLLGQWPYAPKTVDFRPSKRHLTMSPYEDRGPTMPTVAYTLPLDANGEPPMGLTYVPAETWEQLTEQRDLFPAAIDDDCPEVTEDYQGKLF